VSTLLTEEQMLLYSTSAGWLRGNKAEKLLYSAPVGYKCNVIIGK
jgi:hypothetical protein